ncbi:E3 ubiquitin-protein ligase SPL2-like [Magnolia sinica]|uniref:E3 ubiquitin-protein ligase SPL2-like n=1 Tax=Magnolia sinica TaxID=86752 RepID=UPI00265961AB|nr:E3 ubiquitin-protein ligase SPL2-like [Magnolia sinica]
MEGMGRGRKWKSLKQRLRFKGMGCCGSSWGFGAPTQMHVREEEEEGGEGDMTRDVLVENPQEENAWIDGCLGQIPASTGMNLATALAVERHFRAAQDTEGVHSTPERVSLMRRMVEEEGEGEESGSELGLWCIVCMGRKKGAAFIPCGHTFCRVCSRELWLNRGSCPLCNRSIHEILDIF